MGGDVSVELMGFVRNIVFSLIILLIAGSISYVNLPLTDRFEEYVAFVLTTDFDYEAWGEKVGGSDLFTRIAQWRTSLPWFGDGWEADGIPVGPADRSR